tara:strand:- start:449 stop:616 length:168 start_codon:yes stop_codon:yes gene_type:complete
MAVIEQVPTTYPPITRKGSGQPTTIIRIHSSMLEMLKIFFDKQLSPNIFLGYDRP